ncbi:hypothetical protein GETHLI_20440 [Geothrix limicola]|uniref:Response regulatory domain-containing protein n=1 Tax=Geothrix limicola TaxID=2927978 RepID=A0ABQ5QFV7_9BACT|nr:response regulator [Geothrix limicola]GLH73542.1 hypothetical protein GETHLI_20440 [Geothrix limicola]
MPRLLLVDDNPSIHRIAESLLAHTDVELVCVDSAAEALDRLGRGERFDVALVDTAMPGMDGWTLLGRLRAMDATAMMPIALMAGVLDPVDPAKLAKAPIQGFLKKPIELRELGDRVKALLVTPVVITPSPFSTVPATPARDLVKRAEEALPEFRPEPEEEPAGLLDGDLDLPDLEEDLLLLTAEDLWSEAPAPALPEAEAPAAASAAVHPEVHLELEELDLDSLQDLTAEPPVAPVAEIPVVPAAVPDSHTTLELEPGLVLPEDEEELVTLSGLEDLETLSVDFPMPPPEAAPKPAALEAPAESPFPVSAESDELFVDLPAASDFLGTDGTTAVEELITMEAIPEIHEPGPAPHVPMFESDLAPAPAVETPVVETRVPAAATGHAPAAPGHAAPSGAATVGPEQAQALVQALLADPVLVDALVKAVVARMGDQVIREIAWEVMPDLAGRLQR